VPFHTHGGVFAEVLHGRKRWFLAAPEKKPLFHPDETSYFWVRQLFPMIANQTDLLECTLGPGEVRCTWIGGVECGWDGCGVDTGQKRAPFWGAFSSNPLHTPHSLYVSRCCGLIHNGGMPP
jgi:hypothetical protein